MKIVIVGAGEVGFHIASRLAMENKDVVVIDANPEAVKRLSESIDVQTIIGSGSSPSVLEEAGIHETEIMLAVTDSDEVNLVACLVADTLSPTTKKLARLRGADFDRYHDAFKTNAPHIDTVINPETEVVRTIQRLMSVPGAVDVGEFADGRIKFVGVYLDPGSQLADVQLADLPSVIQEDRPLIAAIVRDDRLIIPKGENHLRGGDLVYFISEEKKLSRHLSIFDKHVTPVKRVLIVGGGRIGYRLARRLEEDVLSVKVVERRTPRCDYLAEQLDRAVVLHGDGSDQSLLLEENIHDTDLVVTLTGDEETNILASLLAKRLGAKKTITQINKFSYFPLMSTIGIEQVVSPRLSAINTILQHIRRGKVLSAISIKGEEGEVMEALALPTSDIVAKPLKRIAFPKGSMVAGIIRKDTIIIPTGDSIIEPEDRIIIFATRQAVPGVEKILAVKLEYF
ncbi:Trk system potassium transport protein TrkA [Desulfosarcina ovata subsp. sediminis]|uniref:Trk system potassium uptake protein TrkA n=1 Tax=Desulfosarcina ovata subsp. sediminis TaxID=885957 RepID=A0A5K7ZIP2_9BACT|nr:Trk system potassium transporter TrkA [Desulfosarcina ovata]BBO80751.1 Trk system potassium transport protein TrkA [Desulfosarcina ovata subsp. sediminis]